MMIIDIDSHFFEPNDEKDAVGRFANELEGRVDPATLSRFFSGAASEALAVNA